MQAFYATKHGARMYFNCNTMKLLSKSNMKYLVGYYFKYFKNSLSVDRISFVDESKTFSYASRDLINS